MTLALAFILAACALTWWYRFNPSRVERAAKRKAALAECARDGHDFGGVEHAFESWQFPYRKCRRCGFQQNLDTCIACGAKVNRDTREVVQDGAGQQERRPGEG